ncbi:MULTISPECIES: SIMPL domain-containing protein [Halorussus]|uniref:SIMPL domain-containing protein n=1 Tax=Halorussus TaxID=1070314 RepID=UPI000E20E049|nr:MULTISPECIES: SIMPL domain-containing protein [Halorussus]NHN60012.1 SIMPL domain-containing protein [Halorussus sp. JP-T4]
MRRKLAVLALALLTATAGCAGFGSLSTNASPQSVDGPTQNADRTVQVSASGQVQTAPDRAVVRVAVTAGADSVETVRQRLAENASQLRSALEEAGLGDDQVTSTRYDIGQNYRHEESPSEPKFRGQHAFVVTVDETERAGEIVVTAVENGATRVEDVRFTITQDTRNDLRERALAKAIENARGKAAVAANGTGLELAGVHTVSTVDVSTSPVIRQSLDYAAASAGGNGAPTSFESGSVTVTADAVVVYNATGA